MTTAKLEQSPAVSVVLPVHNAAQTLAATLESLLKQTLRDFELIIIDDGSSDASPDIAHRFAERDGRIRLIQQAKSGLTKTLNTGLRLARAELIARMDADDLAHPTRLMKQTELLGSHPEIAVVGSFYREIDERGALLGEFRLPRSPAQICHHLQRTGNALVHPSVIMRRNVVLAAGGYRELFRHAEDYDLWLRLCERYDIENLDEFLIDYRRHSSGVSLSNLEQQQLSAIGARHVSRLRRHGWHDPSEGADGVVTRQLLLDWGISESELNAAMREWIAASRVVVERSGVDQEQVLLELERRYPKPPVRYTIRSPWSRKPAGSTPGPSHKFSVAIPAYNHAGYLRSAVVSALRSALAGEILIVDDGSADDTRRVISAIQKQFPERITDLTSDPVANLGAHHRLNQLVEAARHEYVAVLNSDDLFLLNRLETVHHELRRDPFDLAFGDMLITNQDDRLVAAKRGPLTTNRAFPKSCRVPDLVEADSAQELLFHQNIAGTTSNFIFSKSCHKAVGGFRDFRYVHDWDFALRALLIGKVRYIRHYLTAYRFHLQNTIMENVERVDQEIASMAAGILADFPERVREKGADTLLTSYLSGGYSQQSH